MKKGIVKIMGASWEFEIFSEKDFIKMHPGHEDSEALTFAGDKKMHFINDQIDLSTVRHEIRHAFIAELCLESASLNVEQFEEIQCSLDQNRWEDMDQASQFIYESLVLS